MRYFVPAIATLFVLTVTAQINTAIASSTAVAVLYDDNTSVIDANPMPFDDFSDPIFNPFFNYDFDLDTPGIQSLSETGTDYVNADNSTLIPDESLHLFKDALRITFNTTGDQFVESVQLNLHNYSPVPFGAFINPDDGTDFEFPPNHPGSGNIGIRIIGTQAGGAATSTNLVIPYSSDFFLDTSTVDIPNEFITHVYPGNLATHKFVTIDAIEVKGFSLSLFDITANLAPEPASLTLLSLAAPPAPTPPAITVPHPSNTTHPATVRGLLILQVVLARDTVLQVHLQKRKRLPPTARTAHQRTHRPILRRVPLLRHRHQRPLIARLQLKPYRHLLPARPPPKRKHPIGLHPLNHPPVPCTPHPSSPIETRSIPPPAHPPPSRA